MKIANYLRRCIWNTGMHEPASGYWADVVAAVEKNILTESTCDTLFFQLMILNLAGRRSSAPRAAELVEIPEAALSWARSFDWQTAIRLWVQNLKIERPLERRSHGAIIADCLTWLHLEALRWLAQRRNDIPTQGDLAQLTHTYFDLRIKTASIVPAGWGPLINYFRSNSLLPRISVEQFKEYSNPLLYYYELTHRIYTASNYFEVPLKRSDRDAIDAFWELCHHVNDADNPIEVDILAELVAQARFCMKPLLPSIDFQRVKPLLLSLQNELAAKAQALLVDFRRNPGLLTCHRVITSSIALLPSSQMGGAHEQQA
jgi:hypothetical protein